MYICHCNALTDADLRRATEGAGRLAEVYHTCGCRAQCGNCAPTVLGILRESLSLDGTRAAMMEAGD
jgi:bacterioferritin-associated ferredoxin